MLNYGDFKKFLAVGSRNEPVLKGIPMKYDGMESLAEDEGSDQLAKTLLKKSLAEHDAVYHNPANKGQHAYKSGDTCNFRRSMMKGDDADTLVVKEKPKEAEQLGLVKFKEHEDGKKEIVGIEAIEDVNIPEKGKAEYESPKSSAKKYLDYVGAES